MTQNKRHKSVRPKLRGSARDYDLSLATELWNTVLVTPERIAAVTLPRLRFMGKTDAKQKRRPI